MDLFRIYYFNYFDFFTCLLWDFKWTVIIITSVSVRAEECAVEWRYVPVTNHSKLQTKSLLLCECTESLRRGWGGQRGDVREEEMEEEKSFFSSKVWEHRARGTTGPELPLVVSNKTTLQRILLYGTNEEDKSDRPSVNPSVSWT